MSKPVVAAIVEIIGGYLGFLGLGWIIAGDLIRGIIIFVSYWIFLSVAGFLTFFTFGILGFIFGPLYLVIPPISGFLAYQFAKDKW